MKKTKKLLTILGLSLAIVVPSTCIQHVNFTPVMVSAYAKSGLNLEKATLEVGSTVKLKVKKTSQADEKVKWSSSDKRIAAVSKKGTVTAHKSGTAVITASVGKQSFSCVIVVKKEEIINQINSFQFRFADAKEGAWLRFGNTDYFDRLTQINLDYRLQKQNATMDEYKEYNQKQILNFSKKEQTFISDSVKRLEKQCNMRGYRLPVPEEIVFIKTTMEEEGGAGAYTHQNQIYLGDSFIKSIQTKIEEAQKNQRLASTKKKKKEAKAQLTAWTKYMDEVLAHELFHCMTRADKDFKTKMYGVIGAEVIDENIEFPKEINDRILQNPDVDEFNNYAIFTIYGEKKKCAVVPYITKEFEPGVGSFFLNTQTKLIPIGEKNQMYSIDEAEDFWTVFGKNTSYILAIEETMADNFSFAVVLDDEEIKEYPNPEILTGIQDLLVLK